MAYGKVLGLAKKVGFQPHNYHKEIVFFFCLFFYFFLLVNVGIRGSVALI